MVKMKLHVATAATAPTIAVEMNKRTHRVATGKGEQRSGRTFIM